MCHMSGVTYSSSFYKVVGSVEGGSFVNGAYPVKFLEEENIGMMKLYLRINVMQTVVKLSILMVIILSHISSGINVVPP